jgi:hypothetical protein
MSEKSQTIEVGAQVQWTKVTRRGRSIELNTRYGEVVEIREAKAIVKQGNGRKTEVRLTSLEPRRRPSAITRLMFPEKGEMPETFEDTQP